MGKTLSKVSLWTADGRCLERLARPNARQHTADYASLDIHGISEWLIAALKQFSGNPIEAIVPVSHGAAVVGLRDGALAFPPMDYEWPIPDAMLEDYRQQRDSFAETGSPALPAGLNLGAQLHFHERQGALEGTTLLPLAQYWTLLLSGVAVSEVTSLGCHSDLWNPATGEFSNMARRRGWAALFAPQAKAADVVGTLKPDLAEMTGLSSDVRIHAGLHDSNAALLAARGFAEIADNEATVLSTGTWFIAMRLALEALDIAQLPEGRDCLVNVDADGNSVPSARFMGGREIETLIGLDTRQVDIKPDQPKLLAAVPAVVAAQAMVLPTLAPGTGPFPEGEGGWVARPDGWHCQRAGACLYAALVTDASLDLISSRERLLIEGRFAEAEVFVRALATLRPRTEVYVANAHNDVSFGALRLFDPSLRPRCALRRIEPLDTDLGIYRETWLSAQQAAACLP